MPTIKSDFPSGMLTLPGVSSLAPAKITPVSDTGLPPSLAIGDLVTWLSARVRSTDEGIRTDMAGVASQKDRQAALSKLVKELRDLKAKPDSDGKCGLSEESIAALEKVRESLGADVGPSLDKVLASIERPTVLVDCAEGDPGASEKAWDLTGKPTAWQRFTTAPPRVAADRLDEAIKSLGDAQQALSTESEMGMIRLQSAMSARAQLLTMVSNILASVNETAKGIIAKVS